MGKKDKMTSNDIQNTKDRATQTLPTFDNSLMEYKMVNMIGLKISSNSAIFFS
jgi:hypothetical protein